MKEFIFENYLKNNPLLNKFLLKEQKTNNIAGMADDFGKKYVKHAMSQVMEMFGDDEELFSEFIQELTKAISRHGYDYIGDIFDKTAGAAPDELAEYLGGPYDVPSNYGADFDYEDVPSDNSSSMIRKVILQFLRSEGVDLQDPAVEQYVESMVTDYQSNSIDYSNWTSEDFLEDFNNYVGDKLGS